MSIVVRLPDAPRRVLKELCRDGATASVIAERLGVTRNTIDSQLRTIRKALEVDSNIEAVTRVLNGHVQVVGGRASLHPNGERAGRRTRVPVAHLGPEPRAVLLATGCCHRLTEDLPPRDVVTRLPSQVTCGGPS